MPGDGLCMTNDKSGGFKEFFQALKERSLLRPLGAIP